MCKQLTALLAVLTLLTGSASGAVILSIENAPTFYTPGTSFSFDVRLQNAVDLNLFSIDLVMQAESGTAGVDFFFDDTLTVQHPTEYVFDVPGVNPLGFFATAGVDGPIATLNLSDLLDIGEEVDTSPVNEFVANVVVQTTSDVGNLSFAFDTEFLELLNADFEFIPDFSNLTLTTALVQPSSTVIPEPSSAAIWLIGAGLMIGARGRSRRFRSRRREARI